MYSKVPTGDPSTGIPWAVMLTLVLLNSLDARLMLPSFVTNHVVDGFTKYPNCGPIM